MIINYHRPQSLEEALQLISQPDTHPLGGGTVLSKPANASFSVVDLQALGLDKIHKNGNNLVIGATVTLQALLESAYLPTAIRSALELETPLNLRTIGTVAGALVTCDGRSPFGTVMLALDAKMDIAPAGTEVTLGNFLPVRVTTGGFNPGQLITAIQIPLNTNLAFETIARTPLDKPIVCAALSIWPSGRTRLALGGWGQLPTLALDGNEKGGLLEVSRAAYAEAGDEWASAAYRMEMAGVLTIRCQNKINAT